MADGAVLNTLDPALQQLHLAAQRREQRGQVRPLVADPGEMHIQQDGRIRPLRIIAQALGPLFGQPELQRCQQGLADLVLWVAEHLPDRALLDDSALLQHHDAVTDIADHRHFMGDQHNGQAQALIDLAQQAENRLGGFRVQRRGGLIAEQNRRVVHQCAGDADALFLPARQLRRIRLVLVLQAHQLE